MYLLVRARYLPMNLTGTISLILPLSSRKAYTRSGQSVDSFNRSAHISQVDLDSWSVQAKPTPSPRPVSPP